MANAQQPSPWRWLAVVLSVAQGVAYFILAEYSRQDDRPSYLSGGAVFAQEIVKLGVSLAAVCILDAGGNITRFWDILRKAVTENGRDVLYLAVPGLFYTIQTTLVYEAVSLIGGATTQVLLQLRVLSTAVFAMMMLGRRFTRAQWGALALLALGAALVQLDTVRVDASQGVSGGAPLSEKVPDDEMELQANLVQSGMVGEEVEGGIGVQEHHIGTLPYHPKTQLEEAHLPGHVSRLLAATILPSPSPQPSNVGVGAGEEGGQAVGSGGESNEIPALVPWMAPDALMGITAAVLASLSSGFCGVVLEKALKQEGSSLWVRNVFLSMYGVVFSLLGLFLDPWARPHAMRGFGRGGIWRGFDGLVWGVVLLGSVGGLLISLILRHLDNNIKNFAGAGSVVGAVIVEAFLHSTIPSVRFLAGTLFIAISVVLYRLVPDHPQRIPTSPLAGAAASPAPPLARDEEGAEGVSRHRKP